MIPHEICSSKIRELLCVYFEIWQWISLPDSKLDPVDESPFRTGLSTWIFLLAPDVTCWNGVHPQAWSNILSRNLLEVLELSPVTWCTNILTFNNCTFCPHCVYLFCIYLRTNSDLCHLQHKLIGFYNRDEKCLLRGTNWVFK